MSKAEENCLHYLQEEEAESVMDPNRAAPHVQDGHSSRMMRFAEVWSQTGLRQSLEERLSKFLLLILS